MPETDRCISKFSMKYADGNLGVLYVTMTRCYKTTGWCIEVVHNIYRQ